jgi:carbonic anhydrase
MSRTRILESMPETTYQRLRDATLRFAERSAAYRLARPDGLVEAPRPKVLWIGCADGRDSPSEMTGLNAEDIVVYRNLANMVVHTDLNCFSVIDYAVSELRVEHVIVCGHYGCRKISDAISSQSHGRLDNWYGHIKDVYRLHRRALERLPVEERSARLVELNVIEQVVNVCTSSIILQAWEDRALPQIHGWVMDIGLGRVKDLGVTVKGSSDFTTLLYSLSSRR